MNTVALLGVTLGILLLFTAHLWRKNARLTAALQPLADRLQVAVEESLRHLHAAAEAKEREDRYRKKVVEAQAERDGWMHRHNDESVGHSNAQHMMLNLIQRLALQLQAKGVDPKIPSVIHQVAADHEVKFGGPARERLKKPSTPPETPPTAS